MIDPPREEAKQAVARARSAGIRPIMITGDHPVTAAVIAAELGIGTDGRAITGAELEKMSDEELAQTVQEVSVYARVNPEHKLRIVKALQSRRRHGGDDRRWRQRRPGAQDRGHWRGHGHHRDGRFQRSRRYGADGRQLRHHRGRRRRRPRHFLPTSASSCATCCRRTLAK